MSSQETKPGCEAHNSAETHVCAAALPVLARQIETARAHAAEAVSTLNRHFMSVMQQLYEMSALAQAVHEGSAAAFDRIDEAALRLTETQAATGEDQADLARRCGALLPEISGLLALARDSGNSQMIAATESIAAQAFELMQAQDRAATVASAAGRESAQRMDIALAPFGEALSKLSQYGDGMRGEISECLVALQFQDRISQILGHATTSMDLLTQYLSGPRDAQSGRRLFAEMRSGYTTDEQHADHDHVQQALLRAVAK